MDGHHVAVFKSGELERRKRHFRLLKDFQFKSAKHDAKCRVPANNVNDIYDIFNNTEFHSEFQAEPPEPTHQWHILHYFEKSDMPMWSSCQVREIHLDLIQTDAATNRRSSSQKSSLNFAKIFASCSHFKNIFSVKTNSVKILQNTETTLKCQTNTATHWLLMRSVEQQEYSKQYMKYFSVLCCCRLLTFRATIGVSTRRWINEWMDGCWWGT